MAEMYDKLGEMLNEALNEGKIPHFEINTEDRNFSEDSNEKTEDSGSFYLKNQQKKSENTTEKLNFSSKPEKTDEKLYKNADSMQFPYNIKQILSTLHIAYPFYWSKIKKDLLKAIKNGHPDTKNTIQSSQNVQFFRQFGINTLISYYKELDSFFKNENK